jgi:hypothetical protein
MDEPDYRSDRSPSPEGRGIAKRAWDTYAAAVNKTIGPTVHPLVRSAAEPLARAWAVDLVGFWVVWHLHGGFEGLERFGYHRATIYRKIKRFRLLFGAHPDEYEFPGITLDPEAYWAAAAERAGALRDTQASDDQP